MKFIPYIIVAIVIAWAVVSIVTSIRNRKNNSDCSSCAGCAHRDGCNDVDKKENNK